MGPIDGRDRVHGPWSIAWQVGNPAGRVLQDFAFRDPTAATTIYNRVRPHPTSGREIALRFVLLRLQSASPKNPRTLPGGTLPSTHIMAATTVASRKRGTAAFLDDPFSFPGDLPCLQTKRGRCSSSIVAADLGLSFPLEFDPVEALHLIFPGEDRQVRRCAFNDQISYIDCLLIISPNQSRWLCAATSLISLQYIVDCEIQCLLNFNRPVEHKLA